MWDGEKVYDVFQILHDEFQIPVHLDLLLKIKEMYFFSYCPFITSLSSLGFPRKNIVWSFLFT